MITYLHFHFFILQHSAPLIIGPHNIPVDFKHHSRARSIRLSFNSKEMRAKVTLPRLNLKQQGEQFVYQQEKWLEKQWEKAEKEHQKRPKKSWEEGDLFYLLGEELRLSFCPNSQQKPKCRHRPSRVKGQELMVCLKEKPGETEIKKAIENFYRQKAEEIVRDRLEYFNEHYLLTYHRVTFRNQKTRWGSCSEKKNLNFNWRLAMAPIEVIDYVVIHELCHLKQMNHSEKFWALVEQMNPEHKKNRKWLRDNHFLLNL